MFRWAQRSRRAEGAPLASRKRAMFWPKMRRWMGFRRSSFERAAMYQNLVRAPLSLAKGLW